MSRSTRRRLRKGSKHLGDTLHAAVDEVLKYSTEEPGVDLLQKTLQKVFARTLGGRDYSMFESVFLGLGLPQIFELLPTVTLNTFGTRALKPGHVTAQQRDHEPVVYDSKVDKFDKRLTLFRLHGGKTRLADVSEAELRVEDRDVVIGIDEVGPEVVLYRVGGCLAETDRPGGDPANDHG